MKVECTNHEFPHEEAQLLADLTVVHRDFERVLQLLSPLRLGEAWQNFAWDQIEMHWNGAVVRYMRAFSDGALDWGWRAALEELDGNLLQTHEVIRAQRNKYIAHSVNGFEEAMPVVQICVGEDGSKEIRAVHCAFGRSIGASSVLTERFHELVTLLYARVAELVEAECSRLLLLALEIGPDTLSKGETWKFETRRSSLTKRRKKLSGIPGHIS